MNKAKLLKFLRVFHSWLGVLVLPWVIIIGATGFYLNHGKAILPLIETASFDETTFDLWLPEQSVTRETAAQTARTYWPDERITRVEEKEYHDRPSHIFYKESGRIIVTQPTGHYFVKTRFRRQTFSPDGTKLHTRIYWSSLFKTLHVRGWTSAKLGTWLADITSLALILFGITGMIMWWMPRSKRYIRKLKRRVS